MQSDITKISALVKHQFPAFYAEQGSEFIGFLEAYYEWMEQEGGLTLQTRNLFNTTDIDNTADQFLESFKAKFMNELPAEIVGNQRLLQKHILDLYRAKGSVAGLKLLFRLLYNEPVDLYVPSYDIFKSSDGVWKEPRYLEVTETTEFWNLQGKSITGTASGATAMVETVEQKTVNNKQVSLVYISNIFGTFIPHETITYEGMEKRLAPEIVGSPTVFKINTSSAGFEVGDVVIDAAPNRQKKMKAVISETYDSVGIIQYDLIDPGSYYSMDAVVTTSQGANTTGIGAEAAVFSITNTHDFLMTDDYIADFINVGLDASTYGFAGNTAANAATPIEDSINLYEIIVGNIERIMTTNPGTGYDGNVTVTVVDPHTSTRGIYVGNGEYGGLDGAITGTAIHGVGLVRSLRPLDSGHGYNIENEFMQLDVQNDPTKVLSAYVQLGGIGVSEGYYDDTKGFTSEDKYLFDGHYYQNFSYVIKSSKAIETYLDILKKTVHIAGNAVYAITSITDILEMEYSIDMSITTTE